LLHSFVDYVHIIESKILDGIIALRHVSQLTMYVLGEKNRPKIFFTFIHAQ